MVTQAEGLGKMGTLVASPFGDSTIAAGATPHGATRKSQNGG